MTQNLGQIIEANRGIFSRAEALDCGETDRTLAAAVRDGALVRLRRGFYTPAAIYAAANTTSAKHVLHARAALAAQRGNVALTGVSAAALHGFDIYDTSLDLVHLLRLDKGPTRTEAGIVHHGSRRDIEEELGLYQGILASVPARAVWEVACRSSLEGGVVTADSALHQMPELKEALEALHDCFALFPGSVKGRTVIRLADGRSDSPGESVTRVQYYRYGIPTPDLQFDLFDDRGVLIGTADFYWEDFRHLGEFDGKMKYQKLLRPGESPSDCVFREKRREDAMRADGRGMSRFIWVDVMPRNARRTMTQLRAALDQSRRLYVHGRTIIA
ncbi:MAG TPA: type IV toxin-antitoxin system AbiEi family antitoxin domain-containing protein [Propionibacteriaceae bacterium]|nr:type IV toxin-antitoxin system AbiEi family antitoxin domain-containing protein [Propionibacteriaceae bacterium]